MANHEKILQLLKTKGQLTSQQLADLLALTMMGARKHLLNLAEQGLVTADTAHPEAANANHRGRPQQYWRLTKTGHQYFPDRHADVSLQLIDGVRQLFARRGCRGRRRWLDPGLWLWCGGLIAAAQHEEREASVL